VPVLRRALAIAFLALLVPGVARAADPAVSVFYYPWYGTPAADGEWIHWNQKGHTPPRDIASSYYPGRGLYSSRDPRVVRAHMHEIATAGIGEVAVSWWGRGSREDELLPLVASAARAAGLAVAAHIEPYPHRTPETVVDDVRYLAGLGASRIYLYRPFEIEAEAWRVVNEALPDVTILAESGLVGLAARGGFDGIYTYDILTFGPGSFARICAQARAQKLLCAPSVGPGYEAARGSGDVRVRPRRGGRTYDEMWRSAIRAGADVVTITSYNEWHEGTQIEPAASQPRRGTYRYATYRGAWGSRAPRSPTIYLDKTFEWSIVYRMRRVLASVIG
jgi:hypothetical protein